MQLTKAGFLFVLMCILPLALGHGRLWHPPSRSSMWRFGYDNPPNYQDNELFCGGFTHQWQKNGGKCGICGDPWDGERENEAGGTYANGIITGHYAIGQVMRITVDITANHLGWFEFRLCPQNDPSTPATQECLDQYLLPLADGSGTRYFLESRLGYFDVDVKLPDELTCTQCVLQWKYNAGNSWGVDPDGTECTGCGAQEQFYGCSDIAISASGSVETTTTTRAPSTATTTTTTTTTTSPGNAGNGSNCLATGAWEGDAGMDTWCKDNCPAHCPSENCICE